MKKFFQDFKSFISRGNIVDMAIGIIIGGAFQKIVSSLVNDIIMPLISLIFKVDITTAVAVLRPEVLDEAGEVVKAAVELRYGLFIQNILDFLIIALSIFIAIRVAMGLRDNYTKRRVKYIKKLKKQHPEYFDEASDNGTQMYEKLKAEHPELFEDEEVEKIEEEAKEKAPTTEELLTQIRDALQEMKEAPKK